MAIFVLMNYSVFNGKILGKIVWKCQAEVFGWLTSFINGQFNPVTDRTTCHRSLFQAYEFAMHFRTSRWDVTDYASVQGTTRGYGIHHTGDNDKWSGTSCALVEHSAWWFNNCHWADLNAQYYNIWAATWQNQQNECAPSEDSDQPGHAPSLIRVFAVRIMKAWVLSYPFSAQRRLWSDLADAQVCLSLRWAHSHFVGFFMSWLISRFNRISYFFHRGHHLVSVAWL